MVFSSIPFIFFFFPLCLLFYYIVPFKLKNYVLLFFSLVFYAWGEPVYVFLMIFSCLFNYLCGIFMEKFEKKKKLILILCVIINILLLGFYKYGNFVIENINSILNLNINKLDISLPIGISFFTFQTMSYVIDVYRKEVKVSHNFFTFTTYVSMFPQLIAGPIVRYETVEKELEKREINFENYQNGLIRFLEGLFKKVLIANTTGFLWNIISSNTYNSVLTSWLGIIAFSIQIYFDFSGYSDMAIGMAKIFGFEFNENFNHPYSAKGIKDFWRRWHISLSLWFREYVYIPLGGNRKGKFRCEFNKMIVFLLTGIWHGANWTFVIWGLIHGVANVIEDTLGSIIKIKNNIIKNIITWIVVVCGFVMFRADSVGLGLTMLKTMFTGFNMEVKSISFVTGLLSPYYIFVIIMAIIFAYPLRQKLENTISKKIGSNINETIIHIADIGLLLVCIISLATATYNPFIYFRF